MKYMFILLLFFVSPRVSSDVEVGVFTASYHFSSDEYNQENPGLYLTVDKWQVGAYKNSFSQPAYVLGRVYDIGSIRNFNFTFSNLVSFRREVFLKVNYGMVYGYGVFSGGYDDGEFYGKRWLPYIVPVVSVPIHRGFMINTHFIGRGLAWSVSKKW